MGAAINITEVPEHIKRDIQEKARCLKVGETFSGGRYPSGHEHWYFHVDASCVLGKIQFDDGEHSLYFKPDWR